MLQIRPKRHAFAKRLSALFTAANRMPKVQRRDLPPALLDHLLDRVRSREVSPQELGELVQWLDCEPEVPTGKWFKRFSRMIVCGEGELVKTFLRLGQVPSGQELS